MSGDEPKHSLAEEAAAWVPPWARDDGPADDEPAHPDEPVLADQPGPVGPVDVESADVGPVDVGPVDVDEPEPSGSTVDIEGLTATEGPAARTPEEERTEPAPLDPAELRGALEAILLVVDEPVTELTLAQVLGRPAEQVGETLAELAQEYATTTRGFELRRAAGGWRLYTRPEYAAYVERFVLDGQQVRLTQASLETLAVVAYKQPVTRSRISAIRGVNCDGVIRTLLSRGLIEECGTEPETGAILYRTTSLFLEKLGMDSVGELPPLAPFLPDDVDEIADAAR